MDLVIHLECMTSASKAGLGYVPVTNYYHVHCPGVLNVHQAASQKQDIDSCPMSHRAGQGLLISINIGVIGALWSNNPASVIMQGNGVGFQSKNLELHYYHIFSMPTTSQCSINYT